MKTCIHPANVLYTCYIATIQPPTESHKMTNRSEFTANNYLAKPAAPLTGIAAERVRWAAVLARPTTPKSN